MTKRILFIGDVNFYSKGSSRMKACRNLGYEIKTIAHTAIGGNEFGFAPQTLIFKIAWKLGIHLDTENTNKKLLASISKTNPDILWIEKGNMIYPKTLKEIKAKLPKTSIISYSDDDMFNPLNRTRAYTKSLSFYDIIFVTKSFNANYNELRSLGAKKVITVDKAFDQNQHYPIKITKEEKNILGAEVSFIGTFAPERAKLLTYLADNKIKVKVWGNGWEKFVSKSKYLIIKCKPLVNQPDNLLFTKGIIASEINLGLLRKINRDLQTDRSIEIPACGGFLLAERSLEHERLFQDGKEAVFYDNKEDLIKKIKYYLINKEKRDRIAYAGYKKCQTADYTHENRMRFMLKVTLDAGKLS